jgi:uncharacterized protein (TIGR03000 family)
MFRHTAVCNAVPALAGVALLLAAGSTGAQQGWPIAGSNWSYYGSAGGSSSYSPSYSPSYTPSYSYGAMTPYGSYTYAVLSPGYYDSGPYVYGAMPSANYSYGAYAPTQDNVARIGLTVPADARVWFDNNTTKQSGEMRYFETPPLAPGRQYVYDVKVRWRDKDGKEVTRTRHLGVSANSTVSVVLRGNDAGVACGMVLTGPGKGGSAMPRVDLPAKQKRSPVVAKKLEGQVAVVTGASQGIGQSTAIRLARDFSALVLVARNRANLERTADAVRVAGAEALVIDVDLGKPSAAQAVVDQTLRAFSRIDALLNIAGAVPQLDLFEMTDQQWEAGLALKLHGARRLTVVAWPALKQAKGSVVLMSGNSAVFPKAPYAAVSTINAAIIALAKAFSDRGIEDGVQVNSVLPGPVMTGRRRSYLEHWAPLHDMTVEEATARFPKEAGIARYGKPEEIAELMAFLVSPGARWMTGSTLRMDGGEVKSI